MRKVTLPILIIFLFSCKEKAGVRSKMTFNSFVFSEEAPYANYSLKFGNNDTVFYQKRFPTPKRNFYSLIEDNALVKLDSFVKAIDFASLDTVYENLNLQDGVAYKFYLTKDSVVKWSYVYGDEGPKSLYDFASWLRKLVESQNFNVLDSTIDFGNLRYVEIPSPPPPKIPKSSKY
jgi:hypothetical protein